jgi:hypothetical protein
MSGLTQREVATKHGVASRSVEFALQRARHAANNDASTLRNKHGDVILQWTKSKGDNQKREEMMRAFADEFCAPYKGKSKPTKPPKKSNENLLNGYFLGDPHFGMRAWAKETGRESFDTEIAEHDLKAAFKISVDNAPDAHTGLFANMGDALHSNTDKPFTAAGTPLDTDGRMSHTVDAIARSFRYAIDLMLKKHKKVIVVNLRGNHDPFSGLMLNKLIQAFYENHPRVQVLDNECKNINLVWGDTLISMLHGDKMNAQKWVNMLCRDHAKIWGNAHYRYGYQGHLHHEWVQEISGITLEVMRTLAGTDAWHAESGYGATRAMSTITFDKRFGRISRLDCPIEMARAS